MTSYYYYQPRDGRRRVQVCMRSLSLYYYLLLLTVSRAFYLVSRLRPLCTIIIFLSYSSLGGEPLPAPFFCMF